MKIRDRVKELRRVRAGDLKPHPKNWRTHSRVPKERAARGTGRSGYGGGPVGPGVAGWFRCS